MNLFVHIISIPKTIYFNFRFLPFVQAVKLPIWVKYNTKIHISGGKIVLNVQSPPSFAMIRIGFHKVSICNPKDLNVLDIHGKLIFNGTAHIGNGTKIYVANEAELVLGDNFAVSASSQINCYKKIVFGKDIQFSWDCLVMDSDTHNIYNTQGELLNKPCGIVFGDRIWIGCKTTILKGSVIPDNCVIGACSLVSGKCFEHSSIIAGHPAKLIKKIGKWEL